MKGLSLFLFIIFLSSCVSQKKIQKSDDHHKIAIGLLKKCDKKRALSHLIKAVEYDPKSFILRHTLAVNYYSINKYKKAFMEFKKSLELEPKLTEALIGIANVYIKLNKLDRAVDYLKKAEEDLTYTGRFQIVTTRALLEYKKGNYLMAQKGFEEAVSIPSGNKCNDYLKLGESQMYLGSLESAETNLKQAVVECKKLEKNSCAVLDYQEYLSLAQLKIKQQDKKKARYYLKLFLNKSKYSKDKRKIKSAKKLLKQIS